MPDPAHAGPDRITFPNGRGQELAGRLQLPARPRAFCVFAHCFTCSKDVAAASRIAQGLVQRGFGVLRFDFTGLGHSGGEFANENFSSNVSDLEAAASWLREHHEAPTLLVGHSLGGAAALAVAHRIPEVRAVATVGAPSAPEHVRGILDEQSLDRIAERGEAEVTIAGRQFTITRQFLDDLEEQTFDECLRKLDAAVLLLHAPDDEIVELEHAARLYRRLRHPKSFVALDGANHLLTRREDAARVADLLSAWVEPYLPETGDPDPRVAELPAGDVLVRERAGLTQDVFVGTRRHELVADEPARLGGKDLGPNPYEFLLTALGSCTTMTIRMYAKHKKWPLERVSVHLHHEKTYIQDCEDTVEDCDEKVRIDAIERALTLEGDLSDEQRARLLEIADRCPVHRTLEGEKRITTRLVD